MGYMGMFYHVPRARAIFYLLKWDYNSNKDYMIVEELGQVRDAFIALDHSQHGPQGVSMDTQANGWLSKLCPFLDPYNCYNTVPNI